MRFLADESLEYRIVKSLRAAGHDVTCIAEENPGIPDERVLRQAVSQDRILVTNDKDFAELAFLQRASSSGILLLRLPRHSTGRKFERLAEVLEQEAGRLERSFIVIEAGAIRIRELPS